MEYEAVIGLEVHAQLHTSSKMFCGCSAVYQEMEPNTVVCPVCMGMPGVLPVPNRDAVEHVRQDGPGPRVHHRGTAQVRPQELSLPGPDEGIPDLPAQPPDSLRRSLVVETSGGRREVGINRVHLEEDVAKLLHRSDGSGNYSLLDINRSGVPLMEIVQRARHENGARSP